MKAEEVFVDVFGKLPNVKKLEIIQYAQEHGEYKAAREYCDEVGITWNGLYRRLRRELRQNTETEILEETPKAKLSPYNQGKRDAALARKRAESRGEVKLSREEKKFLKDLKEGRASLEEASRLVAVKVFEKMLKQPGNVKFLDFFRVELLKIKKMEAETKKTWAMQLVSRMFGGAELPPPVCPHCNKELIPGGKHILEGEIITDVESLPITSNT